TLGSSHHFPLRAPQVLGPDDGLLDATAEADVDEERGRPLPDDGPGHAMEAVVRPPFLQARIDHDRHALAVFEGLERAGDGGKPALARAAAELLPRLL